MFKLFLINFLILKNKISNCSRSKVKEFKYFKVPIFSNELLAPIYFMQF